jgi:hypothetical protein
MKIQNAAGRFVAQDVQTRLYSKARASTSGCWIWQGSIDKDGYGNFSIGKRSCKAHRVSWALANGKEPGGLLVCHACDTPACIHPQHLFLGTTQDNIADKMAKGRQRAGAGSRHGSKTYPESRKRGLELPQTKLTPAQVRWVRVAADTGRSNGSIAKALGVHHLTVGKILKGETWSWLK